MAHSMGGLLAADAATDAFNAGLPKARRILGVVAFDVPYLGMHPHVVVSGLASLFPDDDGGDKPVTEADMNHHKDVKIVDEQVTDDWDAFKRKIDAERGHSRTHSRPHSPLPSPPPLPTGTSSLAPPAPPPRSTTPLLDKTMTFLAAHASDGTAHWLHKHSKDPFTAGTRLLVEYFQFGSCMFDPSGLTTRYTRLVAWPEGLWVNYWTQVPHSVAHAREKEKEGEGDLVLTSTVGALVSDTASIASSIASVQTTVSAPPALQGAASADADAHAHDKAARKREGKGHHFIVLPNGLGASLGGFDKWEKVVIGGVEDEVAAHTGLFIRGQNLEYDALVERVGRRVLGWCEALR